MAFREVLKLDLEDCEARRSEERNFVILHPVVTNSSEFSLPLIPVGLHKVIIPFFGVLLDTSLWLLFKWSGRLDYLLRGELYGLEFEGLSNGYTLAIEGGKQNASSGLCSSGK